MFKLHILNQASIPNVSKIIKCFLEPLTGLLTGNSPSCVHPEVIN